MVAVYMLLVGEDRSPVVRRCEFSVCMKGGQKCESSHRKWGRTIGWRFSRRRQTLDSRTVGKKTTGDSRTCCKIKNGSGTRFWSVSSDPRYPFVHLLPLRISRVSPLTRYERLLAQARGLNDYSGPLPLTCRIKTRSTPRIAPTFV